MQAAHHCPVMLEEVLAYMAPKDGEIYVDGTFGAGGYSRALLSKADCRIYAIDRDPYVKVMAEALQKEFPGRIELLQGHFGDMSALLASRGVTKVDGIVLDVGVSSMQLDQPQRGFSFMHEGPLDMRMSGQGTSAADVVNQMDETALADIIYQYGGERKSRYIARAIHKVRQQGAITTTIQLAQIIRSVVRTSPKMKIDPATRTFQALRIYVNDELVQLKQALANSEQLLETQGRLVIVSFHSLEDQIVKDFLREKSGRRQGVSRYIPSEEGAGEASSVLFKLLTKKAVMPGEDEIRQNIRARSAKLRAAQRV